MSVASAKGIMPSQANCLTKPCQYKYAQLMNVALLCILVVWLQYIFFSSLNGKTRVMQIEAVVLVFTSRQVSAWLSILS